VVRSIFYSLLGILLSVPAFAHSGHEEVMHHWDDIRYIKEIHFQLMALLIIALIFGATVLIKRKRYLS